MTVANEATDTTCFPVFALKATGTDIELKSNTALKFNSDTGELEASKFAISSGTSNQFLKGDGSVDTTTYLSSIADEAITLAKIQHIDTSRILGRTSANAGDVEVLTKANVLTILNVADGAEVNVQSDWNASSGDAHILNKPTIVTAFTGLSDTPANYTSQASKFVKVNAAGNALEFGDDNNTNTFTGLTDTPANYTNSGSKLVAVKSDASGLEYVSAGSGADIDTFLELTDTPNSFTASKFVKVNASANALEFVDDPNTNTTYDLLVPESTTAIRLDPSSGTDDDITITGGTNVTVTRTSGTELTFSSVNTTYGAVSTSAAGLAPQLPASHGGKFLKADATWEVPPDTTYGLVSTSANGLAPQLPATHGDKFLKADGSWEVPAYTTNTNTTYGISCVDGDNADEEKIRLTGANPTTTDDIVLEAGTGLSIARDGDKITFTNTISDTNTNTTYDLSVEQTGGNDDNPILRLDPSSGTNDDITITGGTNVTVTRTSGTELTFSSVNTTYGLFTTSANGLAPQLPAAHGGKFLKADGSWEVPAYTTNTNDNDYVNSLAFNTSTGVLTAGRTGSLADLTVDLDGKYAESGHTHSYQTALTFSSGITNTSGTVTVDSAVRTTVAGASGNSNVFTIDTIALNSFRLLEYTIHVRHSSGIQAQKLLVMCDGTNHHHTEYGVMYSAALLGTFSTSTSGSNVLVRFDPVNTSTTIDFIKQVVTT